MGKKETIEKENSNTNYSEIGFRCGLEIHQQLETRKLFCNCQSIISTGKPDKIVMRRLRAAAGESGKIDVAAEHEQKKGKQFFYHYFSESSCLVELDEEPPRPISDEALNIALQAALLLNMKLVDQVQTMRKMVIDGSNTTGFQRTSLIARNGFIETSLGNVGIQTLCLEEESAQLIERNDDSDTYNLSRLGIPLIEIATDADIKNPIHAMECAEKLGMVLRSLDKIKRGIGSIRQDVNLSIKGSPRVEIKGFQDLKSMPKVIEFEIKRQIEALHKGDKLKEEVRKAEPDFTTSFLRPMPSSDRMYPETDVYPTIINSKNIILPELIENKTKRYYSDFGLSLDLAKMVASKKLDIESLSIKYSNIKPLFLAEYFLTLPKEIKRRFNIEVDMTQFSEEILEKLNSSLITKEAVIDIVVELTKGNKVDYSKFKTISDSDVEDEIKKIVELNPGKTTGALMGIVMSKFRGKVDGKKIAEVLNKLVGN